MNNNKKYEILTSTRFKKQLKKIKKQGKDINKIKFIINELSCGNVLDTKYKDHQLYNNKQFKECRECHIEPDWLLIYKYNNDRLILYLIETGSHSDLLNM